MNIPERLSQLIFAKIQAKNNENFSIDKSKIKEEPHPIPQLQFKAPKTEIMNENIELSSYFDEYKKNVVGNDLYIESLETLMKIFQNITDNPKEEKFRKVKISNKVFLEKIRPYQAALKILEYVEKCEFMNIF